MLLLLSLAAGLIPTPRGGLRSSRHVAVAVKATAAVLNRDGLKAQILQVAALTDRGQRLNTLSEWHALNARPTH